jgi:hypothetical protein
MGRPAPACGASTWTKGPRRGPGGGGPDATLLVAGENGMGKRTLRRVPLQSRGGKGIITMKTTEKTGAGGRRPHRARSRRNHAHHGPAARWSASFVKATSVKPAATPGRETHRPGPEGDRLQAIAPVISESHLIVGKPRNADFMAVPEPANQLVAELHGFLPCMRLQAHGQDCPVLLHMKSSLGGFTPIEDPPVRGVCKCFVIYS